MKNKWILVLALALLPSFAHAQSTTVSGQVTDAGGQSWNNGTLTAQFVPNPLYPTFPQYSWTGGTLNQTITGTLNGTGGYSISIPSNTSITPVNSFWQIKFCPQASSPCFTTANTTITGGTQTVNATPPAIFVVPGPGATAYADSEITGAVIGSTYYNTTSSALRVCNGPTTPCTWGASGSVNGAGSNPLGASLNVRAFPYSAVGNGKFFVDGVSNAGNNQLTSATATFAATDVGQTISCYRVPLAAGTTIWVPGQTTVASFVNSSTITYSGTNNGVQSGMFCTLTNPADHTAIDTAFSNALSTFHVVGQGVTYQAPAQKLYFPIGIYGLDKTLNNLIVTGNEPCVGIKGDSWNQTVLIPEGSFTSAGKTGLIIHDQCQGADLEDFTLEMASNPLAPGVSSGSIATFGSPYVRNVAVYDGCFASGGPIYGFVANGGSDVYYNHPKVISSGTCSGTSGGLEVIGVEGDVYSPFLSNTSQNLLVATQASGSSGAGLRFWGGVIDEGSVTKVQGSVDTWFVGVTLTGGTNCLNIDGTSQVWVFGGYCGTFGGNTGSGPLVQSGGQLFASDMHVNGVNATSYCWSIAASGGLVDLGGNNCTTSGGATTYASGSFVTTATVTHTYPEPFLTALPTSGTAQTIAAFTPSNSISVKNFTITSSNTPTCATPPTFSISNGTTTITQTFASSSNVSGPTTPTQTAAADFFVAGTQVTLSITTAAYTCATAPVNMNFAIEWQSSAPSL